MKQKPLIQLFFLSLVISFFPLASHLHAEDDWGSSHNLLLKGKLSEDWFVISRSNLATRRDHEQLFLGYTGASLGYQFNKNWSGRLGYRFARFRIGSNWRTENRPLVEIYYANKLNGWRITSRSRAEYRLPKWKDHDIRLRQEVTITAPWKFTSLEMKPFLEEEIFYSTRNNLLEANWFTVGFAFSPIKNTKVKFGYRHNRLRLQGDFKTRHTFVTGLNIFF